MQKFLLNTNPRVAWSYVIATTVVAVPVAHLLVIVLIGPELWGIVWREVTVISGLMAATFSAFIVVQFMRYTKKLQELLHETRHDDLTGLMNRKGLRSHFKTQVEEVEDAGYPIGVLLSVDLDNFKAVNDTHGHYAGDEVLVEFARRLRGAVRAGDVVARVGGDEFIVFLHKALLPEGAALAERIRDIVSGENFAVGTADVRVTASIGLIDMQSDETASDIMKRVDGALYTAKDRGGNVVFVESLAC